MLKGFSILIDFITLAQLKTNQTKYNMESMMIYMPIALAAIRLNLHGSKAILGNETRCWRW